MAMQDWNLELKSFDNIILVEVNIVTIVQNLDIEFTTLKSQHIVNNMDMEPNHWMMSLVDNS